jgi:hypothetical protein
LQGKALSRRQAVTASEQGKQVTGITSQAAASNRGGGGLSRGGLRLSNHSQSGLSISPRILNNRGKTGIAIRAAALIFGELSRGKISAPRPGISVSLAITKGANDGCVIGAGSAPGDTGAGYGINGSDGAGLGHDR